MTVPKESWQQFGLCCQFARPYLLDILFNLYLLLIFDHGLVLPQGKHNTLCIFAYIPCDKHLHSSEEYSRECIHQHLEKSITSLLVVAVSQTDTPIIMCSHQLLYGSIAPGIDMWCLLMPTDYVPSQEAMWRWWRLTTNGSSSSMDARLINGTVTHNLCLNFDSVCATHAHHIRSLNHTSQLSLAAVCFHRIGFWFR